MLKTHFLGTFYGIFLLICLFCGEQCCSKRTSTATRSRTVSVRLTLLETISLSKMLTLTEKRGTASYTTSLIMNNASNNVPDPTNTANNTTNVTNATTSSPVTSSPKPSEHSTSAMPVTNTPEPTATSPGDSNGTSSSSGAAELFHCFYSLNRSSCIRSAYCVWSETQSECIERNCDSFQGDSCPPYCVHCANNLCAAHFEDCEQSCKEPMPILCADNTCVAQAEECPCPPLLPFRCNVSRTCVANADFCGLVCPQITPMKCWSGECSFNALTCPCDTAHSVRCPSDGNCYASLDECPCPVAAPYRCHDGSCSANCSSLICYGGLTSQPSVQINAVSEDFEMNQWLRISSTVKHSVCGIDQSSDVEVIWEASYFSTGSSVQTLSGRIASFAPFTFTLEGKYLLTVIASVKRTDNSVARHVASVVITGIFPPPQVQIMGGQQRVVGNGSLSLTAAVEDFHSFESNEAAWHCHSFYNSCPSMIVSALNDSHSQYLVIAGPIPTGNYTFTFEYKGISCTQLVAVMPFQVPQVQFVNAPQVVWNNRELLLYATVKSNLPFALLWMVGNDVVLNSTTSTVTIPSYWLPVGKMAIAVRAIDSMNRIGEAMISVNVRAPPKLTCSVLSQTDSQQNVALTSKITIETSSNVEIDTNKFQFMFGYIDPIAQRNITLSPCLQSRPRFEALAPLLPTSAVLNVVFWVQLVDMKSEDTVTLTKCNAAIGPATGDLSAVIASQSKDLSAALNRNDTSQMLQSAYILSVAWKTEANFSSLNTRSLIVDALAQRVAAPMSSSERSQVIQTLDNVASSASTTSNGDQVLSVLQECLSSGASIGIKSDFATALSVVDKMRGSQLANPVAQTLARQVAAATSLGGKTRIKAGNIAIEGVTRVGTDLGSQSVGSEGNEMRLPSSFMLEGANETTTVSLASVEFEELPGKLVAPSGTTLLSHVVDFAVVVDGSYREITHSSENIIIQLKCNCSNNSHFMCKYLNSSNHWDSQGVEFVLFDNATGILTCTTTHLSTFAAFVGNAAGTSALPTVEPTTSPGTMSTVVDPDRFSSNAAILVGCGALLLFAVLAAGYSLKKKATSTRARHADSLPLESSVMTALPSVNPLVLNGIDPPPGMMGYPYLPRGHSLQYEEAAPVLQQPFLTRSNTYDDL